jgi:hypothetical protein
MPGRSTSAPPSVTWSISVCCRGARFRSAGQQVLASPAPLCRRDAGVRRSPGRTAGVIHVTFVSPRLLYAVDTIFRDFDSEIAMPVSLRTAPRHTVRSSRDSSFGFNLGAAIILTLLALLAFAIGDASTFDPAVFPMP